MCSFSSREFILCHFSAKDAWRREEAERDGEGEEEEREKREESMVGRAFVLKVVYPAEDLFDMCIGQILGEGEKDGKEAC